MQLHVSIERLSSVKGLITERTLAGNCGDVFRIDVVKNVAALRLIIANRATPHASSKGHHFGTNKHLIGIFRETCGFALIGKLEHFNVF